MLKGPSVAHRYEDPQERIYLDIDLPARRARDRTAVRLLGAISAAKQVSHSNSRSCASSRCGAVSAT